MKTMRETRTETDAAAAQAAVARVRIPDKLFFRIGDVATLAGVKPYVLRFWESEFPMIAPQKSASGQRVYRRSDVETVLLIKHLLYEQRFSIEGARRRIRELRKEGDLKTYKQETVGPTSAELGERLKALRAAARELQKAAELPLEKLFRR
jgi:DNA-binding transcriptional MerR regulator